ncbi:MAG: conserved hypothetical rane spanning protein [Chloroflexi bacterium]|nr:conserved hypothetical rane spanning protein [Chloroflexota bacterium]
MEFLIKFLAGCGLAIPCGIKPYLPLGVLSVAGLGGRIPLSAPYSFLATWTAVIVLVVLIGIDIFADKLPQIEKLYTYLNYIIRPVAGAIAFAAIVPPTVIDTGVSFLLGMVLAEVTYLIKTVLRPAIASSSRTASVVEPLISSGENILAVALAMITVLSGIVGGVLSLLVLLGMLGLLFAVRRRNRTGIGVATNLK